MVDVPPEVVAAVVAPVEVGAAEAVVAAVAVVDDGRATQTVAPRVASKRRDSVTGLDRG